MSEAGLPQELTIYRLEATPKETDLTRKIHFALNLLYESSHSRNPASENTEAVQTAIPHRYSGEDSLSQRVQAVRSVLSTGTLPNYRSISDYSETQPAKPQERPTVNLHVFCEVGPFASFSQAHFQKLQAIASWHPLGEEAVHIVIHPFDNTPTLNSLRGSENPAAFTESSIEAIINPYDDEAQRLEKIMRAYKEAQSKAPEPPIPTLDETEDLLLTDPYKSIYKARREIESSSLGSSNMFAAVTTRDFVLSDENGDNIKQLYFDSNENISVTKAELNQPGPPPIAVFSLTDTTYIQR